MKWIIYFSSQYSCCHVRACLCAAETFQFNWIFTCAETRSVMNRMGDRASESVCVSSKRSVFAIFVIRLTLICPQINTSNIITGPRRRQLDYHIFPLLSGSSLHWPSLIYQINHLHRYRLTSDSQSVQMMSNRSYNRMGNCWAISNQNEIGPHRRHHSIAVERWKQ